MPILKNRWKDLAMWGDREERRHEAKFGAVHTIGIKIGTIVAAVRSDIARNTCVEQHCRRGHCVKRGRKGEPQPKDQHQDIFLIPPSHDAILGREEDRT